MSSTKRVCIDPGHGGKDPGAIGPTGLQEKAVVLAVGLGLRDLLVARGVEVTMTREDDRFLSLGGRAWLANDFGADAFLSIHCNSAGNPAMGIETFCARRTKVSYPFAEAVQDALTDEFPTTPDRGVKRANFTVLTETEMAACLAELEFIHVPRGEEILASRLNQATYARALAAGVLDFLGLEELPEPEDPEEPPAFDAADMVRTVRQHAEAILAATEAYPMG